MPVPIGSGVSSKMRFLKLKLEGPLQSWGERSRWDSRDTTAMPTKSAVIGLLGCCLGYPRHSEKLNELDAALHLAVRADEPGRILTDFHTVQTEEGKTFPTASGGKRTGNTIITPKQYLQGARFTVFLWGDEEMLAKCAEALLHPHWTPYLGRRNCVPSSPLIPQFVEAADADQAVRTDCTVDAAVEIELLSGDAVREDEHVIRRLDSLVDASCNEYKHRYVRASWIRAKEESACI